MNDMDVSIIVVNYNTLGLTSDCIDSIADKTSGLEYEIILVDNASTDSSKAVFSQDPRVRYIYSDRNLGFGRANNLGVREATGRYLFFLNSDTILLNNAVKYFFDFCEKNPEHKIGALGAILKDRNLRNIHSYGRFITPLGEIVEVLGKYFRFLKKRNHLCPASVQQPKPVDYITGADLFVPRTVYDELGAFDPAFFMYCEEVDWQFRMSKAGYERLIIEGPEIIHLEGGSDPSNTRSWSFNRIENIFRSKLLYIRKHYNYFVYWSYKLCNAVLWLPILLLRKDTLDHQKKLLRVLFFNIR
ncbi:glycosyl transferase [Alistipes onderdonkii subsp. vulgaris]|nr:glycosyl transferase [Alistipes onderdonkii subsp. vulgaris]